jgi:hypothetical protein
VGVAGFFSPVAEGTHFSALHNLIHIVVGFAALWFGLRGSANEARRFSWAAGVFYVVIAVIGLAFGREEFSAITNSADPAMLFIIPGVLEFGRSDHVLHLVFGIVFVAAACLARPMAESKTAAHAQR